MIYTEHQKIYRNLCRPAVGVPGMEPKRHRALCGGLLPHHEHRGDQGAAGCGSGRAGLRPFPLDHFPYHEVNKYQHKRALALTARKLVRLVFRLLKDNRLYIPPEG